MEKTVGLILVLLLAGCGVDAPPTPPGQENPETIRSLEDLSPESYF